MKTYSRIKHLHFLWIMLVVIGMAGCSNLQEAAKRGVKNAAEREVEVRSDRATTDVIDKAERKVRCAAGDSACADRARSEGKEVVFVDANDNEVLESSETDAAGEQATDTPDVISANYDFTPGDRVLYEDDFENVSVGDFPSSLYYVKGLMEVVDRNGQKLLRANGNDDNQFQIEIPGNLPEQFTLEFDLHDESGPGVDIGGTGIYFGEPEPSSDYSWQSTSTENAHLRFGDHIGLGLFHGNLNPVSAVEANTTALQDRLVRIEAQVDGDAIKVYVDKARVVNVPRATLGRSHAITFTIRTHREVPTYIDNIRVAAGGMALYETLAAEGRVATHGILFDTGNATILPESEAVLEEISNMLQQYSDLKLRIEGHTDNVGSAEDNLTLSESRAKAVRDYLVNTQGISAGRLQAQGMGQEFPVADNRTEEGKKQNRRVELVRL